jgi:protein-S-isoprenylcysteine O-methyltransferase Ste14
MMELQNVLFVLLALAIFGVTHSLAAGDGLKRRLAQVLGVRLVEGWYRLAYNLFSLIMLAPALAALASLPDQPLYRVSFPWSLMLNGLQVLGAVGFSWAILSIDGARLIGIRQARAFLKGDPLPLPDEPLQAGGVYGLVRHPLYTFSLLMVWAAPVMTLNTLTFNLGATLYILIGSLIEERRLAVGYGEAYHSYRQHIPWLIPWLHQIRINRGRSAGSAPANPAR